MKRLEALRCQPCCACRAEWARVWTVRDGVVHLSELSWALARRILPRLALRHGIFATDGLFTGRTFLVRHQSV